VSDKGSQNEDQKGSQKKLLKQEKRLRDSLLEAQQEQDNALERLRRAEARLRKRVERVQRLQGQLNSVDQQMKALNAPLSTIVTLIPTVAASSEATAAPSVAGEETSVISEVVLVEQISEVDTTPEPDNSSAVLSGVQVEQAPAGDTLPEQQPSYSTSTNAAAAPEITREEEGVVAPALADQPTQQATEAVTASVEPVEVESTADEMLVGEAEPQFLERFSASIDTPLDDEEASVEEAPASSIPNPAILRAREARAVAEVAEEAAREAIERAEDVADYLEQIGSARHLMQELAQLEDEAAQAATYAREAEEAALEAERAAAESEVSDEEIKLTAEEEQIIASIPPEDERELDSAEVQDEEASPLDAAQPDMQAVSFQDAREDASINGETSGVEIPSSLGEATGRLHAQADGASTYAHPTPLEAVQVEEIDEEEEALETVTAMIIADAAAIAAAEAEALAEASSARTREARSAALAADRALGTVRMAVRNGILVGDEAAAALNVAEHDATHAHAVLADAEAAEDRARTTAMNAEAEAEVAEGMAFASGERNERDEKLRDEYGTAHPLPVEASASAETDAVNLELGEDDEDHREDTQKLPRVRPEQA
jgi:hypothetical protein